jgi:hypothetical protein
MKPKPAMCEKCGKAPALVNLNTGKTEDGQPGPDLWRCAVCLTQGFNSPEARALTQAYEDARALTQADEDAAEYRESGGRLN